MSILHRIAHRLGWYYGDVAVWWDGDRLMIGFQCRTCGKISGVHESLATAKDHP